MNTIRSREDAWFEIAKNPKNVYKMTDHEFKVDKLLQELVETSFEVVVVASCNRYLSPDDVFEILSNRKGYSFEETIDEIISDESILQDLIEEYFYNKTFSPHDVEAFKLENTKV